jgi:hypothetical protein
VRRVHVRLVFFGTLLLSSLTHADEELMRKYEPFLAFHKEERYEELFYPMDIEAYLSKCSLWYVGQSAEENDEGTVDVELLAALGRTRDDSDELYLKLVEKHVPLDLAFAQPKGFYWDYTQDASEEYLDSFPKYTYYFRQFTEPDYGYIVLQYWFFYAFNSWGAYPFGYNIHEGDWESLMFFLHPVTQHPVYVACSAHHEKEDRVTKRWDDIKRIDTHPQVFVALGSHANYFEPRSDTSDEIPIGEAYLGAFYDIANGSGMTIGPSRSEGAFEWAEWEKRVIVEDESRSLPDWARFYNGKWGMDATTDIFGFSAPRFPPFQNSQSSSDKWHRPAKWAGIKEVPFLVKGDVNDDGKVRSNDAILVLCIVTALITPTDSQKWAADMNNDGGVGSDDAILILRKAAGLAAPSMFIATRSAVPAFANHEKLTSWSVRPEQSALLQNFPNPFNPETWIPYHLREASEVTIQIYRATGELVQELRLGYKPAGSYLSRDTAAYWDGTNRSGAPVASGLYFYSIRAGDFAAVRKLTVLK